MGFQPREINRASIPLVCLGSWGSQWEPEVQALIPSQSLSTKDLPHPSQPAKVLKRFNKYFSFQHLRWKCVVDEVLNCKCLAVISEKCNGNQNTISKKTVNDVLESVFIIPLISFTFSCAYKMNKYICLNCLILSKYWELEIIWGNIFLFCELD